MKCDMDMGGIGDTMMMQLVDNGVMDRNDYGVIRKVLKGPFQRDMNE